jgi:hypothetical protein
MGKGLVRDEQGRLPLSPKGRQVYSVLKAKMGNEWVTYSDLFNYLSNWNRSINTAIAT